MQYGAESLIFLSAGLMVGLLGTVPARTDERTFTLVAFGASTTAPRGSTRIFADRLREGLEAQGLSIHLINAGVGGNTTEMARARFERDVLAHHPDLVVIGLGINDAAWDVWKDPPATGPRVTLDRYLENMTYFTHTLRDRGAAVVVLAPQALCWTPHMRQLYGKPPYDPNDSDGFNVILRDYVAALREWAAREAVPLVDAFQAFQAWARGPGRTLNELLPDGMHPNSEGHALIAGRLVPEVRLVLMQRAGQPTQKPGK